VLAGLGDVVELHPGCGDPDVLAAQRGQSERAVVLSVGLTADPEQAEVEQPEGCGHHAPAAHPALGQVRRHPAPGLGQPGGDLQHAIVLAGVAVGTPLLVVSVLSATRLVRTDRLQVAVGPGADPDVGVGGRNGEPLAPLDDLAVADPVPLGVVEDPAPPGPTPGEAGHGRAGATQPHPARGAG